MSVSVRHVKRLKYKVGKYGAESMIHGNRGRESNRRTDPKIVEKAKTHLKKSYYDFGPTLATEKLYELHDIKLGKETVRGMMTNLGLWKPKLKKQSKKWHVWRARKDNYGEMELVI
jgi:hypothetical protein